MKAAQLQKLEDVIAKEVAAQNASPFFQQWLKVRSSGLHRLISLPAGREEQALKDFAQAYISCLPRYFAYFEQLCESAQVSEYADLFVQLAWNYLVTPPKESERDFLMHEAFMAHRIFEELNDRCGRLLGAPVTPEDTSFANLVVHGLIGDAFANELDVAVHYALEAHRDKEQQMLSKLTAPTEAQWQLATQDWGVFGEEIVLGLNFRF